MEERNLRRIQSSRSLWYIDFNRCSLPNLGSTWNSISFNFRLQLRYVLIGKNKCNSIFNMFRKLFKLRNMSPMLGSEFITLISFFRFLEANFYSFSCNCLFLITKKDNDKHFYQQQGAHHFLSKVF